VLPMRIAALVAVFGCFGALTYSLVKLLYSERLGYEDRAVAALGKKLSQLYVFIDPERFYHFCIVAVVICFLLGFMMGAGNVVAGLLIGAVLGSLGLVVPWVIVSFMVQKRLQQLAEQLPEGLDMLSSSLKAGVTLPQAIARCADKVPAPLRQELRVITQEQRLGHSVVDALHHWAERTGLRDIKLVVIASEVSLRLGGDLAGNYGTLSQLIRQRHMFQREISALTAEGRLQGILMAALPFIVLAIMSLIDRERMLPFITSTLGICLIALVAMMQIGAYFWIKKITNIEM